MQDAAFALNNLPLSLCKWIPSTDALQFAAQDVHVVALGTIVGTDSNTEGNQALYYNIEVKLASAADQRALDSIFQRLDPGGETDFQYIGLASLTCLPAKRPLFLKVWLMPERYPSLVRALALGLLLLTHPPYPERFTTSVHVAPPHRAELDPYRVCSASQRGRCARRMHRPPGGG